MANPLQFDPVYKDRLFYDQYGYCISFFLREIGTLRPPIEHYKIDMMLDHVEELMSNRLVAWARNITLLELATIRNNLHELADVLLQSKFNYKIVTSYDTVWIYTNDIALICNIKRLEFILQPTLSQAIINRPKNTIKLKNPVHKRRSYFKFCTLTLTEKDNIIDFFATHADNIRTSAGLNGFIESLPVHLCLYDHYFVDYTDDYWLTMLMLKFPKLIRKTLEIIPA